MSYDNDDDDDDYDLEGEEEEEVTSNTESPSLQDTITDNSGTSTLSSAQITQISSGSVTVLVKSTHYMQSQDF
jgi:hypothetical protein